MDALNKNDFALIILLYHFCFIICTLNFYRMTAAIGYFTGINRIFQD